MLGLILALAIQDAHTYRGMSVDLTQLKTTENPRMKKMEVSATRAVSFPAEPDTASARNWS